ncbi:MAG: hypothetical protein NTV94_14880 [Planctomycetota bacterium]|nr:hypothetical protein [Planctomycetota bacterium]
MIRIHQSRLSAFAGLAVAVFTLTARGDFLTDAQLWFDPATIQQDYYPQVRLSSPTHSWVAAGDPIIDFDVLPLLKQGTYTSGYVYQQSDYFQRPNIDYSADLTAGTVTATFTRAGMYHVRITRQSGAIETVAVFNRSGPLGDDGPHKTGAARVVISPDGDLFLVANEPGDEALSNAAGIINDEGYDWDVMNNKADIAAKARAKALELGRPTHSNWLDTVARARSAWVRTVRATSTDSTSIRQQKPRSF